MCDGGERERLPAGRRPRVRTTPSHGARPSPTPEADRALGPESGPRWRLRCPDRGSQDNILAAAGQPPQDAPQRVPHDAATCSGALKGRDDSALGRFWAEVLGWGVSSVGHTSEGTRSDHCRRGPRRVPGTVMADPEGNMWGRTRWGNRGEDQPARIFCTADGGSSEPAEETGQGGHLPCVPTLTCCVYRFDLLEVGPRPLVTRVVRRTRVPHLAGDLRESGLDARGVAVPAGLRGVVRRLGLAHPEFGDVGDHPLDGREVFLKLPALPVDVTSGLLQA